MTERFAETECPTCGPTQAQRHPRRPGITRCANCGEWLSTAVLEEVRQERKAQDEKWGQQDHRDGTRPTIPSLNEAEHAKHECDYAFANGLGTWRHILREEVGEAFAESDPARLRAELLQVAAVAVAWVEAIDRRSPPASTPEEGTR